MTAIANRTIKTYLDTLSSDTPAPGGGSVAGLVGSLAAGLGQMVANLTVKSEPNPQLTAVATQLHDAMNVLLATAELDEGAFSGYLAASRLPKSTTEEKAIRREAMQQAIRHAAEVPLTLATTASQVLDLLEPVARLGTRHATSDTVIAVSLAEVAVLAALDNVRSNVPLIKDPSTAAHYTVAADNLSTQATTQAAHLRTLLTADPTPIH